MCVLVRACKTRQNLHGFEVSDVERRDGCRLVLVPLEVDIQMFSPESPGSARAVSLAHVVPRAARFGANPTCSIASSPQTRALEDKQTRTTNPNAAPNPAALVVAS